MSYHPSMLLNSNVMIAGESFKEIGGLATPWRTTIQSACNAITKDYKIIQLNYEFDLIN